MLKASTQLNSTQVIVIVVIAAAAFVLPRPANYKGKRTRLTTNTFNK